MKMILTNFATFSCLFFSSMPLCALQALDDAALARVNGRDGLTVDLQSNNSGVSAQNINLHLDDGTPYAGTLSLDGVRFEGKSDIQSPTVADAPVHFTNMLDIGSNGSEPRLRYELLMNSPARLTVDNVTLGGAHSFGTSALEADNARLVLVNKGIFSADTRDAYLLGEIHDASLFYRQLDHPAPYLTMDNLDLLWEIPKGTLGIINAPLAGSDPSNSYGILMASGNRVVAPTTPLADTLINFALDFDLKYRDPISSDPEFMRDDPNASPVFNFAWKGAFKDARLIWGPGGEWGSANQADQSARPGGLRLESRWNYVNHDDALALGDPEKEFRWRFAEAAGDKWGIELSDWRNLPGADYAHDWPLIALDVIPPDATAGGLCWGGADNGSTGVCAGGGSQLRLAPGEVRSHGLDSSISNYDALAIMARDGNILAYSNRVKIMQDTNVQREMDWGLVYTLANVDGNIYAYPGGNPGDISQGMVMDILLMSQSFDGSGQQNTVWNHATHWDQGMHLMIADTAACSSVGGPIDCVGSEEGMGIGLIGSSLLMGANDTRFWIKPGTGYNSGIDLLSPQTRIHLKGTFGGGTLPGGLSLVRGALVDINAEGLLNLRLSPSSPGCDVGAGCFLGYSMAVRLYDIADGTSYPQDSTQLASGEGSYIKLAELNRPDMAYTLGNITGDFAITNGKADMRGPNEDADNYEKLRISNDILFGSTANDRLLNGSDNGLALPGGVAPRPFMVNDVALGPDRMGSVVVPSGQWHFSATLRPQTPSP